MVLVAAITSLNVLKGREAATVASVPPGRDRHHYAQRPARAPRVFGTGASGLPSATRPGST